MSNENKFRLVILTLSMLVTIILYIVLSNDDGVHFFLGDWKGTRGDVITLAEVKTGAMPLDTIEVGGDRFNLLLPVEAPNVNFGNRGGIYRIEGSGELCLVLWCNYCRHNIIMALKKADGNMLIGLPDKGYNDKALGEKMIPSHDKSDWRYNPQKWLTYTR